MEAATRTAGAVRLRHRRGSPSPEPRPRNPIIPPGYMLTNRELRFPNPYENGMCDGGEHTHPEHVVFWPNRGSGVVEVNGVRHNITVGRGLWIPSGTPHVGAQHTSTTLSALYIDPAAWPGEVGGVRGVSVNAALREMLLHLAYHPMPKENRLRAQRVCLELITEPDMPGLELPMPQDSRVLPISCEILKDPADDRSLEDWAWLTNMSARTIARAFRSDTGMTFSQWRTVVRMTTAVRMLTEGVAVGTVSRRVGYTSVSAFSAAFRRLTGRTPQELHPAMSSN